MSLALVQRPSAVFESLWSFSALRKSVCIDWQYVCIDPSRLHIVDSWKLFKLLFSLIFSFPLPWLSLINGLGCALCVLLLELPVQQCSLKVSLQSSSNSKQCKAFPLGSHWYSLNQLDYRKYPTFRKCSVKVEKDKPWIVAYSWSTSCQLELRSGEINKWVGVWNMYYHHTPVLPLSQPPTFPIGPTSALWKLAAVGVPISAPQTGKVNYTKNVTEVWITNIWWCIGQLSWLFL